MTASQQPVGGVQPITPDEAGTLQAALLPDAVFEAFNEQIARSFDGKRSVVMQSVVAALIVEKTGVSHADVSANKWLDVEESYRARGWNVEYDKPGYNERHSARFIFSRP